ncbi:MAG TPA: TrbI/VirB10 family protein [Candidatus Binataceae bacterium]|jgi:type IV secretory pathway VirB10-like protein|nr:TrbI/VirB10 family protein [Candidatus Binataceae bacterium]
MPTTPQPRGVSHWFAVALISAFSLGLITFFVAIWRRPAPAPAPPALRDARGDEGWVEKYHPTPAMESTPAPYAPLHTAPAAIAPPPLVLTPQQQRPYARATVSQEASERMERYHRALASDIGIKESNGQTLETPRLLATGQTTPNNSPINVSARPAPPHTISAWTWIYGTLETGVDSDHPGDVLGRVSQDVKDSVTQTEVLIPMGSKLHGYQSGRDQVQQHDASLLVAWNDIEFPNGGHIQLPNMPGADTQGFPGFEDLVNNHYARTWTPAVLISAITAGTMLASHPTYGSASGYTGEQQALGAGAETLGGRATGQLSMDLNQNKPTLTIEPGYHFRVLVTRDMIFSGPYGAQ